MALLLRRESRVSLAVAAGLSVILHVGLLLLILHSGAHQGAVDDPDAPITHVLLLDAKANHGDGIEFTRHALASLAATARVHIKPPHDQCAILGTARAGRR